MNWRDPIVSDPDILLGKPTIKGTTRHALSVRSFFLGGGRFEIQGFKGAFWRWGIFCLLNAATGQRSHIRLDRRFKIRYIWISFNAQAWNNWY